MRQLLLKTNLRSWFSALLGALLYILSYKLFIVPLDLYIGGYPGIAQILSRLLSELFNLSFKFDFAGVILWFMNIPMFFLIYKIVNLKFFAKTILTILFMSLMMVLIPVPNNPYFSDTLLSCLVGGALSGIGIGIMLKSGSCGGGLDILGLYLTKKRPTFSVGQLALFVNFVIYTYSAFKDSLEIAVYSLIFALIAALMTDKLHYQNIATCVIIISKVKGIERPIIEKMKRGVTLWQGFGGYYMENSFIYMTLISKHERHFLEQLVKSLDASAFIIFDENHYAIGNFEKRFDT